GVKRVFAAQIEQYKPENYIWTPDNRYTEQRRLVWSPDGRLVLLQALVGQVWRFSIFGLDGTERRDVAHIDHHADTLSQTRAVWSADSRTVIFLQQNLAPLGAIAYHIDEQRYERLPWPPAVVPLRLAATSSNWVALPQTRDGKRMVELLDMSSQRHAT